MSIKHDSPLLRRKSFRRLALPISLIAIGLWLLTGCFYLPIPEQKADKKDRDFRPLLGDAKSVRPIRPGTISRPGVITLLGPPEYASADRRSIGYTFLSTRAVWVFPLCFQAPPALRRGYALRLTFDDRDILTAWEMEHVDEKADWLWQGVGSTAPWHAMERLNQSEPRMLPANADPGPSSRSANGN